jgi:hypothetical protein
MQTAGITLAPTRPLVTIHVILIAGDCVTEQVTVSTAIDIDLGNPHRVSDLAETIAFQVKEGARHLSAQLLEAEPPPSSFVPLAAVVAEART